MDWILRFSERFIVNRNKYKSILLLSVVLLLYGCNESQQKARRLYDLPDENRGFVAFSPDNKLFAMPVDNNQVAVYKISNRLHDLYDIGNKPGYVTFSWDSNQLAVITDTGLQIWDTKENVQIQTLSVEGIYRGSVSYSLGTLAYSQDDSRLALNASGHLRIWDVQTGDIVLDNNLNEYGFAVGRIIFSPDADLIAYVDDTLHIFNIENNERVTSFADAPNSFAFNSDGTELILIISNRVLKWNIIDQEYSDEFTLGEEQTFNDFSLIEPVPSNSQEAIEFSFTYHPDSDDPTLDAYISRWNIETKELIWREQIENLALTDFHNLIVSPSGETAVLFGVNGTSNSVWEIGD